MGQHLKSKDNFPVLVCSCLIKDTYITLLYPEEILRSLNYVNVAVPPCKIHHYSKKLWLASCFRVVGLSVCPSPLSMFCSTVCYDRSQGHCYLAKHTFDHVSRNYNTISQLQQQHHSRKGDIQVANSNSSLEFYGLVVSISLFQSDSGGNISWHCFFVFPCPTWVTNY